MAIQSNRETWLDDIAATPFMVRVLPPGTMEEYVTTSEQSTAESGRSEDGDVPGSPSEPMISLRDVHKVYRLRSGKEVRALDGLSLDVAAGSIHGIVGTSGAGKSTLVRCLTSLERPTSGHVSVAGQDMTALSASQLREAAAPPTPPSSPAVRSSASASPGRWPTTRPSSCATSPPPPWTRRPPAPSSTSSRTSATPWA